MHATESSMNSTRMPRRSSAPTALAAAAPIPGTRWARGPARFTMATYGGTPSATCWPP